MHDLEHTVRQSRLLSRSARNSDADGSRSEGLRMKQLPVAIAMGAIHSGTMTGS